MPGTKRARPTRPTSGRRVRRKIVRRIPRRIPRSPTNTSVSVKRTLYAGNWVWGTASTSDFWRFIEYSLASGFNNHGEFTPIFDRYRINAIRVQFLPRFDWVAAPTTGATPLTVAKPRMAIINDAYSNLSPSGTYTSANLNSMMENGATIYDATKPVTVYWKPAIPYSVSGGVTFKRAPFLRTTETSILHRGFHAFIFQNNFTTTPTDLAWDIMVTMYVTFKDLR